MDGGDSRYEDRSHVRYEVSIDVMYVGGCDSRYSDCSQGRYVNIMVLLRRCRSTDLIESSRMMHAGLGHATFATNADRTLAGQRK